jgi:crotonobetainyl-CoA:carnitine CoA-transferase CaiB-like acyl-CoA transferase
MLTAPSRIILWKAQPGHFQSPCGLSGFLVGFSLWIHENDADTTKKEAILDRLDGLDRTVTGALSHLCVLDLTSSSVAYCGKLFADLGAEVIKVEPPGADPGRGEAPFFETECGRQSLPFLYGNTNKRSVLLDLEAEVDRARFRALALDADLILEAFPVGTLDALGIGYRELAADHPELVLTSMTGFGQTGPQRGFRSNDLVASALGGAMISIGDPADPPVRLAGHQADVSTATLAAASSLIALSSRDRTGQGQHVDISSLEVIASITHIAGVGKWLEDGILPKRVGTGLVASVPSGAYRCKDGLVYLMVNRPAHWEALARWINEMTGNQEVLLPEFNGPSSSRLPFRELLDVFIGDLTSQLTVDEMYHEGQRRHIAVTPVQSAGDIVTDPHLLARKFFVDIAIEPGGRLSVPGPPFRLSRTPSRADRSFPQPGEHNREILESARAARPQIAGSHAESRVESKLEPAIDQSRSALEGLRIVEFGTGLAAPWIGRMLAWAGAEVIKVESHAHPDVPRLFVPPREPELGTQPQCSPWFTDWSAGKRFVALDLRNDEGAELARQIVDQSDAVIANYSTGVLEKLGLGYETLAARNPELVMLESSGYGESGPMSHYITWGPNIEALSGLSSLSGFPERECTLSHFAYPDPLSALHGLFVLLAGLAYRDRSGEGQLIHLSQFETTVAAIGPLMLEAAVTGKEPPRLGNRERDRAPYGCFPCLGDDRWCVLCIEDDEDWNRFREVMGHPDWAEQEPFATMASRVTNVEALESRVSEWTKSRRDYEIMENCQRVGLAAGVVQSAEDLLRIDPQLAHREFFEEIPHFKRGSVVASGIPLGLTGTPGHTPHAGSAVGHDNQYVFREILDLSEAEVEHFVANGAIEEARR